MKDLPARFLKIIGIVFAILIAIKIYAVYKTAPSGTPHSIWSFLLTILFLLGVVVIYFVPYSLAKRRNTINKNVIFWINLLFGLTIIGWCFALLLASTSQTVAAKEIEDETLRRLRKDINNSSRAS